MEVLDRDDEVALGRRLRLIPKVLRLDVLPDLDAATFLDGATGGSMAGGVAGVTSPSLSPSDGGMLRRVLSNISTALVLGDPCGDFGVGDCGVLPP